jgi:DNA polymerase elongation subunit (family B)
MKNYSFQLVSWWAQDVVCDEENDDDDEEDDGDRSNKAYRPKPLKYFIKMFGRDADGKSVSCTVADFTPYFFVKLKGDRVWTTSEVDRFTEAVYRKMNRPWLQGCIIDARVMKRKDFWGFTDDKQFNFLRLCFVAERHMKQVAKSIATATFYIPGINQRTFALYESNIAPFLRFAHIQSIAPAGWVTVPRSTCTTDDVIMPSKCDLDFQCFWKHVTGEKDRTDMAPLKIASFDIECMSSDMDFPVAQKTYVKIASDFYNLIHANSFDATKWKSKIVDMVMDKYETKALIPFNPSQTTRTSIEQTLMRHADHIMLIARGDKTICDNEMRNTFASVELQQSTLVSFVAFVDKVTKTSSSVTATRLAMGAWLRKVFAKIPSKPGAGHMDADACIGRIIGIHMREKDAVVDILMTYLDGILPAVRGDEIIQIGVTTHRYGQSQCSEKVMVSLGTCDPIPGVRVIECATERELIHKWVDVMSSLDPDIVCGYNIFGFDYKFIHGRAQELGCMAKTEELGRLTGHDYPATYKEARLSSSALGDNVMYYFDMPGRTCMDLMKVIQRDHKLDSYKLDNVASHFMGMNKKDVSPADIFRLAKGTSTDRAIVADYCIQDCELCNHLVMKLEIVANNVGMASVCSVPLHYIFMRGQGVKIFSLVAKMCRELGYVVPTLKSGGDIEDEAEDVEGYEGAIVLEPKVGMYIDTPIAVLDYASLYPASMISGNLSHDCIVLDPDYDNLPGVTYRDVAYDIYEGSGEDKTKVGERKCRFAHKSTGVIPFILQDLLKQRKLTRKRMTHKRVNDIVGAWDGESNTIVAADGTRTSFDPTEVVDVTDAYSAFEKATLDGLQQAYKVTANSLYGQVGSRTSPIYLKDIAACTTATGRGMILLAKDFLETNYEANIIYGDSVPGYTPCIIRTGGKHIRVVRIEDIPDMFGDRWTICRKSKKEANEIGGIETWTSEGWTTLKRVIRHPLAAHKSIIRVYTPCGLVDVTDDHSLITADGSVVSPIDLGIDDALLGAPSWTQMKDREDREDRDNNEEEYTVHVARMFGMFMVSGHVDENANVIHIATGVPGSMLDEYRHICELVFPRIDWRLSADEAVVGSGDDELYATMRKAFPDLCFTTTEPSVPSGIMDGSTDVRRAFWNGICDGTGGGREGIVVQTQVAACSLMLLMRSIDMVPWLDMSTVTDDGTREYVVRHDACPYPAFSVRKLAKVPHKGTYVYDLTTDNHQFQAGAGHLIVHNTDSLFVHFPKQVCEKKGREALQTTIDTAIEASEAIKPKLDAPHDLEYEKTYWPFLLFSKKRYVANQYGKDVHKHKQSSMGIVLKRRDNAPIVKIVYGGIIDIILNKHDVPGSIEFLSEHLDALAEGKRGLDDLIISKSLKGHYKDPSKIAHKVLADRIKERNPGNAPQVNDRIPYVYVISEKAGKVLQGDKIEHPDYIKEKGLRPDYEFYITNQIMKPVLQLYALVLEQLPGYTCERGHWNKIEKQLVTEGKSVRFVKDKIREMREAEVKKLMFDHVLTRIRRNPGMIAMKNRREGNHSITEWFSPRKSI